MGAAELRILCGPTGAGKSALALELAERYGATIISADSRQIYRGFDVGTAKPTTAERERVPYRGIDIVDPDVRYSAAAWATAAEGWIDEATAAGRAPLVVGGTGLYLRALEHPLFAAPALDETRRAALGDELALLDTPELQRWCAALDPPRAHLGRAQLLRAIEIAVLAGRRHSELLREDARAPRYQARYLVVDPGAALGDRLVRRTDAMFDAGWEDEVRGLMGVVPPNAPAWNSCGYGVVRDLVSGAVDRAMARTHVIVATRQYAKRQRTWFRHQLGTDVTRASPGDPDFDRAVMAWWGGAAAPGAT